MDEGIRNTCKIVLANEFLDSFKERLRNALQKNNSEITLNVGDYTERCIQLLEGNGLVLGEDDAEMVEFINKVFYELVVLTGYSFSEVTWLDLNTAKLIK